MKKIDLVVGARPNFIKAFPVYSALKEIKKYDIKMINTGQHYDENMSKVFFDQLKMKKPDYNLNIGSGSHGFQTGKIMIKIEKIFIERDPDLVIVFGDVNSTIAAAMAATKLKIKVAHVEAGLRSFDRSMPEELNRVLTDQISDLLFITSKDAEANLLKEGKNKNQIKFVGNTMIDSLIKFESYFNADNILNRSNLKKNNYILVTIHRPSNVDNIEKFKEFVNSINKISEKESVIWPIHPRTKKIINNRKLIINNKITTLNPIGYLEFMALQKNAKLIITDSGGVQEESTYFNIPCLTIRNNTERPVTISEGSNILFGDNFGKLIDFLNNTNQYIDKERKIPQFWDGKSSQRIAKHIMSLI